MASTVSFQDILFTAFVIVSIGILTSLVRGPVKRAKETERFKFSFHQRLTRDVISRIIYWYTYSLYYIDLSREVNLVFPAAISKALQTAIVGRILIKINLI